MKGKCVLSIFLVALFYASSFQSAEGCCDGLCELATKKMVKACSSWNKGHHHYELNQPDFNNLPFRLPRPAAYDSRISTPESYGWGQLRPASYGWGLPKSESYDWRLTRPESYGWGLSRLPIRERYSWRLPKLEAPETDLCQYTAPCHHLSHRGLLFGGKRLKYSDDAENLPSLSCQCSFQ